jgi:hypothetical protein
MHKTNNYAEIINDKKAVQKITDLQLTIHTKEGETGRNAVFCRLL